MLRSKLFHRLGPKMPDDMGLEVNEGMRSEPPKFAGNARHPHEGDPLLCFDQLLASTVGNYRLCSVLSAYD